MHSSLPDIQTEADVRQMVDHFYALVQQDELIGPVFNDHAKVDWDEHLPKMYRFWNTLIFAAQQYKGAPFPPHISLGLSPKHFDVWIGLFIKTVDTLFDGPVAENTKQRAQSIAAIFNSKLGHIHGKAYTG